MQIPAATQLSHAAALAAATSQFYEYQVSRWVFTETVFGFYWIFFSFLIFFLVTSDKQEIIPWNWKLESSKGRTQFIYASLNAYFFTECVSSHDSTVPGTVQRIWNGIPICCYRWEFTWRLFHFQIIKSWWKLFLLSSWYRRKHWLHDAIRHLRNFATTRRIQRADELTVPERRCRQR